MTPIYTGAAGPVRVLDLLRDALSRISRRTDDPDLPFLEQLRDVQTSHQFIATAPIHVIAAGGRIEITKPLVRASEARPRQRPQTAAASQAR